ncbi:ABC transporter permease [Nitratireductor soli]|uniref:ABC transporter permease n=1 Tax=Nitratireductor soli TaxID=1670619 RepID=UPI00065E0AD4|nr:ABC transporter permease [Nitratireductor soli]
MAVTDTVSLPAARSTAPTKGRLARFARFVRRHPNIAIGALILTLIVACSALAPLIAPYDPDAINPAERLKPPSAAHLFGTDAFGRDVLSRVIWGGRISLVVGLTVALFSVGIGLAIGLVAGFSRIADAVLMRVMDAMMAIPGILLAIALVALTTASIETVVFALVIPEIPRVVRLVRAMVLSLREQPFVDAARAVGTRFHMILIRHIMPNTVAPLIVQATFICAFAILGEAYLSFLGVGLPPPTSTWGSVIAEGRKVFGLAVWVVLFPGLFLGFTVLSINLIGDGLRDILDPKLSRRQ